MSAKVTNDTPNKRAKSATTTHLRLDETVELLQAHRASVLPIRQVVTLRAENDECRWVEDLPRIVAALPARVRRVVRPGALARSTAAEAPDVDNRLGVHRDEHALPNEHTYMLLHHSVECLGEDGNDEIHHHERHEDEEGEEEEVRHHRLLLTVAGDGAPVVQAPSLRRRELLLVEVAHRHEPRAVDRGRDEAEGVLRLIVVPVVLEHVVRKWHHRQRKGDEEADNDDDKGSEIDEDLLEQMCVEAEVAFAANLVEHAEPGDKCGGGHRDRCGVTGGAAEVVSPERDSHRNDREDRGDNVDKVGELNILQRREED